MWKHRGVDWVRVLCPTWHKTQTRSISTEGKLKPNTSHEHTFRFGFFVHLCSFRILCVSVNFSLDTPLCGYNQQANFTSAQFPKFLVSAHTGSNGWQPMASYHRRTEGAVHSVMFNSSDGVSMDIFCHQPNPKIKAKHTTIVANSDPSHKRNFCPMNITVQCRYCYLLLHCTIVALK